MPPSPAVSAGGCCGWLLRLTSRSGEPGVGGHYVAVRHDAASSAEEEADRKRQLLPPYFVCLLANSFLSVQGVRHAVSPRESPEGGVGMASVGVWIATAALAGTT
eukprot:gene27157-59621_t